MSFLRGALIGLAAFLLLSDVGAMLYGRIEVWPTDVVMILVISSMVFGGRKAAQGRGRG